MPTMPHRDAGPLIDPPVHDPRAPITCPAATAEPDPLLEPPVACSRFQGLRAGWNGDVKSGAPVAYSCITSLPTNTAPASLSLATTVASSAGTRSKSTLDAAVVRTPAVSYRSFRP